MASNMQGLTLLLQLQLEHTLEVRRYQASGYTLVRILMVRFSIATDPVYRAVFQGPMPPGPIVVGGTHVKLPEELGRKKGLFNPQNEDANCFRCCVMANFMYIGDTLLCEDKNGMRWPGKYCVNFPKVRESRPKNWKPIYRDIEGWDFSMLPFDVPWNLRDHANIVAEFERVNSCGVYVWSHER